MHDIFRWWCGLNQLDLDMQAVYKTYSNRFIEGMCALIGYLRRQYTSHSRMQFVPPRFVPTRWAGMKRVTSSTLCCIVANKIQVFNWLEENLEGKPRSLLWVLICVLDIVAGEVLGTVSAQQGKKTIVSQQNLKFAK